MAMADVNKAMVTILIQETLYVVVVQMYQDCRYQNMYMQTHVQIFHFKVLF